MGTVLITGATSGIGREIAWEVASGHHRVILVARNLERLIQLATQIEQIAGVETEVLAADLATEIGRNQVTERLKNEQKPTVDLLVNNAGFGIGKNFQANDLPVEQAALAVMVTAVMELSHAALPRMLAQGRGAILNIASLAALSAQGTYSAHKAWVRTFSESLAAELRGTGVQVCAVCPGLTRSEFHLRQGISPDRWAKIWWTDPSQVAHEALQALRRGQVLCTPNPIYKVAAWGLRFLPRCLVRRVAGPHLSAHEQATQAGIGSLTQMETSEKITNNKTLKLDD